MGLSAGCAGHRSGTSRSSTTGSCPALCRRCWRWSCPRRTSVGAATAAPGGRCGVVVAARLLAVRRAVVVRLRLPAAAQDLRDAISALAVRSCLDDVAAGLGLRLGRGRVIHRLVAARRGAVRVGLRDDGREGRLGLVDGPRCSPGLCRQSYMTWHFCARRRGLGTPGDCGSFEFTRRRDSVPY